MQQSSSHLLFCSRCSSLFTFAVSSVSERFWVSEKGEWEGYLFYQLLRRVILQFLSILAPRCVLLPMWDCRMIRMIFFLELWMGKWRTNSNISFKSKAVMMWNGQTFSLSNKASVSATASMTTLLLF